MIILQITRLRLLGRAADVLTANQHARTVNWLATWNALHHYKAVVAGDMTAALAQLRQDLETQLMPGIVATNANLFEFEVVKATVENGRFWLPNPKQPTNDWHKVVP